MFRRDPDNKYIIDRQPKMMERKAKWQECIDEKIEQAEQQAKKQRQECDDRAEKHATAQLKIATKQARVDRKAYVKSIHDAIIEKYCPENPDFTPGVARDGYAF